MGSIQNSLILWYITNQFEPPLPGMGEGSQSCRQIIYLLTCWNSYMGKVREIDCKIWNLWYRIFWVIHKTATNSHPFAAPLRKREGDCKSKSMTVGQTSRPFSFRTPLDRTNYMKTVPHRKGREFTHHLQAEPNFRSTKSLTSSLKVLLKLKCYSLGNLSEASFLRLQGRLWRNCLVQS